MNQRRGLEIRAANAADAAGLSALLKQHGAAAADDVAGRLDAIRDGAGTVLVALDWGPPAGVVALHWFASLGGARRMAQIDLLLVAPQDRRRGIGRLLVKAASQAARVAGCGDIALMAGATDLREFCLATGFAETGALFWRGLRKSSFSEEKEAKRLLLDGA